MKKNIWIAVVLALVLMLGACGHAAQPAGSEAAETQTPAPTETPAAETAAPEADYDALYGAKLTEIRDYILTGNSAEEIPEGLTGIREMMSFEEPQTLLDMIGYQIRDLSGDGVPELLIGTPVETTEESVSNIFALYTVKDGAVQLVQEGWTRNAWCLMADGGFYNSGSNGAAYALFGTYDLDKDGTKMTARDFYFTYEKTEGNYDDIGVFHNTTGVYDTAQAELLDITTDELWEISAGYQNNLQTLELTALATIA